MHICDLMYEEKLEFSLRVYCFPSRISRSWLVAKRKMGGG